MLQYDFIRHALITGCLLALILPCIGVVVVLRRLSMIGDALSHTSLAGVAAGLLLGVNPVFGAVLTCVAASLCIEAVRKRVPQYAELSVAVILSAGVGLAGVLSGKLPGTAGFNSFLFGSIIAVSRFELVFVAAVSAVVLAVFLLLYRELFAISFDERSARMSGVRTGWVQLTFTVMTAVSVSIAARTVGTLIVSSLMVLPVTCAMQLARSYRATVIGSVLFAQLFTLAGLCVAFYAGLRPGATIVLVGVGVLVLILCGKSIVKRSG